MGFLEDSPIGPEYILSCSNKGCHTQFKKKNAIMIVDPEEEQAVFFCSKRCRREYTDTGQDIFEDAP